MCQQPRLDDKRQALVRKHLGLVTIHLNRFVPGLTTEEDGRAWDDLYQEGCLGLARAASRYQDDCGIPFAAYAIPRIHNAVSLALQEYEMKKARQAGRRRWHDNIEDKREPGSVMSSPIDIIASHGCETVGDRIRQKYERAVADAARTVSAGNSTRGDRIDLVRALVGKRFLIPSPDQRTPLRQIARETRSSYGRVADCSRVMTTLIGHYLQLDPEFKLLDRVRNASSSGNNHIINDELESKLLQVCKDELNARLRNRNNVTRLAILKKILESLPHATTTFINATLPRLSPRAREELLACSATDQDQAC
ncbi:MAG: sigma-70 family RNA polymerase sigma factor [Phycisphaerae bacterium]